jgi:hypothetical protein
MSNNIFGSMFSALRCCCICCRDADDRLALRQQVQKHILQGQSDAALALLSAQWPQARAVGPCVLWQACAAGRLERDACLLQVLDPGCSATEGLRQELYAQVFIQTLVQKNDVPGALAWAQQQFPSLRRGTPSWLQVLRPWHDGHLVLPRLLSANSIFRLCAHMQGLLTRL